jgi:hypothetical protein
MKVLIGIFSATLLLAGALPSFAQGRWDFSLAPSAWGAGLDGDVQIGPLTEELRVNYGDRFGGAELGGSLAFEGNNGRYGFIVEGLSLDVSGGAEPPDIFNEVADTELDHLIVMAMGTYRVRPVRPSIDFVLGVRYIGVDVDMRILDIDDGLLLRQGSTDHDWVDAVLGARVTHDFGDRFRALGHLDVGGGESRLSYHLILEAGYRFSKSVTGTFGYKLISTDYEVSSFNYSTVKIGGPYVGAKFTW